ETPRLINIAASVFDFESFSALAQPRLDARPVRVDWHRAYQHVAGRHLDPAAPLDRYRALAAAEPRDSALAYLQGRLEEDPAASMALFEQAMQLPQPTPYAAHALAFYHAAMADYASALRYSDQARASDADDPSFAAVRRSILHGL